MTTIVSTDIPSSAKTSLETLATWSILALSRCNPSLKVLEVDGETQRAVETAIVFDSTGKPRLIGRVSIELSTDYATDLTTKLWAKAQELDSVTLPDGFKVD